MQRGVNVVFEPNVTTVQRDINIKKRHEYKKCQETCQKRHIFMKRDRSNETNFHKMRLFIKYEFA